MKSRWCALPCSVNQVKSCPIVQRQNITKLNQDFVLAARETPIKNYCYPFVAVVFLTEKQEAGEHSFEPTEGVLEQQDGYFASDKQPPDKIQKLRVDPKCWLQKTKQSGDVMVVLTAKTHLDFITGTFGHLTFWWKQAWQPQVYTVTYKQYICSSDRVLINVTGCDQGLLCDMSSGRSVSLPLCPFNHNNPNGLWWAPPSCLSNWCKYHTFELVGPPTIPSSPSLCFL